MPDKQRLRAFLLGGVAGIVTGVLLAPRSGRELRGVFRDRAEEARERSRETLFEAQERMQERLAEAREGTRRRPDMAEVDTAAPETAAPREPGLRAVTRETGGEEVEGEVERSEELRRKVRETRARITERLDRPGGGPTR